MMDTHNKQPLPAITLAAIGVVYGDIGTSPLYTFKECFSPHIGLQPTQEVVFGFLSLIFWSLILVVSLKYLCLVLRADNRGEGGILTLMSLAGRNTPPNMTTLLLILGLIGGGFFYGEVVITPAMSVLSALEGLEVATPLLTPYILPVAIGVLTGLFFIQKHGTAKVGRLFGPVMLIWFVSLGLLGAVAIVKHPQILAALNPMWGLHFFAANKWIAFVALGSVVLAITGVEALYADMGHFGRLPIRIAWFAVVLPALLLNYFGQGALLLQNPQAVSNPFFNLAPPWALVPLVILATLATVIASQAVVSGVFSLTRQAVRLGYLPGMTIKHTSESEAGQIYLPFINWMLFVAVLVVVVIFRESSNLAAAYGIAVTGTMVITSLLVCSVARYNWDWPPLLVRVVLVCLLIIDVPFFAANVLKLLAGGWLPLALGCIMFTVMATWKWERFLLFRQLSRMSMPLDAFILSLNKDKPARVPGTAVYMARTQHGVPLALLHNLKHNKVLHERVVIMSFRTQDVPYVEPDQHIEIEQLSDNFWRIYATYGFHETPDVEEVFRRCTQKGMPFNLMGTSFFLSRETLIPQRRSFFAMLRVKLFILLSKNSLRANDFFHIPANRVVELGVQVEC